MINDLLDMLAKILDQIKIHNGSYGSLASEVPWDPRSGLGNLTFSLDT